MKKDIIVSFWIDKEQDEKLTELSNALERSKGFVIRKSLEEYTEKFEVLN